MANIVLAVASGDEFESVRRRIGLIDPPPEDLNQVLNKIRTRGRSDALCAVLALPEQSISVNGVTLLNPPAHWNKLSSPTDIRVEPFSVRAKCVPLRCKIACSMVRTS